MVKSGRELCQKSSDDHEDRDYDHYYLGDDDGDDDDDADGEVKDPSILQTNRSLCSLTTSCGPTLTTMSLSQLTLLIYRS